MSCLHHPAKCRTSINIFDRYIDHTIVKLRFVGENGSPKALRVQYGLIRQASKYFENCFKHGVFEEGETKVTDINGWFSERAVNLFMQWLSSGSLKLPNSTDNTKRFPTETPLLYSKQNVVRCKECGGVDINAMTANGFDATSVVEWQKDLFELAVFAKWYQVPALLRHVILKWQTMEERWDSVPRYAIIIQTGDLENKACIPEKGTFSRYLVERYRYRTKANWFNYDCNCCLDRPSTTTTTPPPRHTLPDSFQAKMVGHGPDSWAPFFLNWCDFHDHESEGGEGSLSVLSV